MDLSSRRGRVTCKPPDGSGGYDRHPLFHTNYSMEIDVVLEHSQQYGNSLKERARRRRKQFLRPVVVVFGMVVVGCTVHYMHRRSHHITQASTNKDASSSFLTSANAETPPPLPTHLDITCGAPNVVTLAGAVACEQACSAARCCTDTCWSSNKEVCMKYHERCVILDESILSTGSEHVLPVAYKGGWFEDESKNRTAAGPTEEVLTQDDPRVTEQYARDDACRKHTTKDGLKTCVKLCIPATCCHAAGVKDVKFCRAQNSLEIDCRHYYACDALYTIP